jgi:hypothetical protein
MQVVTVHQLYCVKLAVFAVSHAHSVVHTNREIFYNELQLNMTQQQFCNAVEKK